MQKNQHSAVFVSTSSSGADWRQLYRLCKLISGTFPLQNAVLSSSSVELDAVQRAGAAFDAAATCQLFALAAVCAD